MQLVIWLQASKNWTISTGLWICKQLVHRYIVGCPSKNHQWLVVFTKRNGSFFLCFFGMFVQTASLQTTVNWKKLHLIDLYALKDILTLYKEVLVVLVVFVGVVPSCESVAWIGISQLIPSQKVCRARTAPIQSGVICAVEAFQTDRILSLPLVSQSFHEASLLGPRTRWSSLPVLRPVVKPLKRDDSQNGKPIVGEICTFEIHFATSAKSSRTNRLYQDAHSSHLSDRKNSECAMFQSLSSP